MFKVLRRFSHRLTDSHQPKDTTMQFTTLEQTIIRKLKWILEETECVSSYDLIKDDPKALRGALSSLITKGVIYVATDYPDNINGKDYYPLTYWDEDIIEAA